MFAMSFYKLFSAVEVVYDLSNGAASEEGGLSYNLIHLKIINHTGTR